jgi:uncharacterized protein with FMN-binding domain
MKKWLIVVFVVAILGGAGGYLLLKEDSSNPAAQNSQTQTRDRSTTANQYKDGTYTSDVAETLYGDIQISIIITGGKISDVEFNKMPGRDDGRTIQLTEMSRPLLEKTTLEKQSDKIDFVTGATSTSYGYQESLQSALDKAFEAS